VILVGIEDTDQEDIDWLGKITKIRIFDDENQVMNLSVQDIDGEIIVVSQFTLHASTKGNRPSYIKAAKPDVAIFINFIKSIELVMGKKCKLVFWC
jgi:D-tyrosyl-tRNA(Tyr) deacylase